MLHTRDKVELLFKGLAKRIEERIRKIDDVLAPETNEVVVVLVGHELIDMRSAAQIRLSRQASVDEVAQVAIDRWEGNLGKTVAKPLLDLSQSAVSPRITEHP